MLCNMVEMSPAYAPDALGFLRCMFSFVHEHTTASSPLPPEAGERATTETAKEYK